jgi:hypothetical protein
MPVEQSPHTFQHEGFSLPYSSESGDLRFNVMAIVAVICLGLYAYAGYLALLVIGVAAAGTAYYFFPLLEKKPRIGAGQYGVFIDGFGVIAWRGIGPISLSTYVSRLVEYNELHLKLVQPLDRALLADWRNGMPWWRIPMKLPWIMTYDNVIRIKLEPFGPPPEEIARTFQRMQKYYGGRG